MTDQKNDRIAYEDIPADRKRVYPGSTGISVGLSEPQLLVDPTALLVAALTCRWFQKAYQFNTEVLDFELPLQPTVLSPLRLEASLEAFREEDDEFIKAVGEDDVLEAADALLDGIYFRLGRLVEMGVPPGPLFDEIQRANMDKVPGDLSKRPGWNGKDAVKPEGWKAPDHTWLLSFRRSDLKNLEEVAKLSSELELARHHLKTQEDEIARLQQALRETRKAEQADLGLLRSMSPVWKRLQSLRDRKTADYDNVPGGKDAYFPFGHMSYAHMLNTKNLRIMSLVRAMINNPETKPNFESIVDTVEDLINYATYYAEAIAAGKLEQ